MASSIQKYIRPAFCIIISLYSSTVNAQISPIQNLLGRLESYKNFSYQAINKKRDMSADTTIALNKELFLKAPNDKQYGYFFSIETNYTTETFHTINLYNGEGFTVLSPTDSTFFAEEGPHISYSQSIIGELKFLQERYNKSPFKIMMLKDTVINRALSSHIIATVTDTIDNNEHLHTNRNFYVNKQTGLPNLIVIEGRYKYAGAINNYYDETKYFDYKTDQPDVTVADFTIPKNFKPRKEEPAPPALLNTGTIAPDWTLFDANDKKLSLSQLKGKIVLLDFYFIGCAGCMASIKPLNAIYEKYKNKDLIIASLSERDSKKAVLDFEKRYKINYTGYVNTADVVKSYHVSGFPTFYFIDKEGMIRSAFVGYNDDFEEKVTAIIDKILNK